MTRRIARVRGANGFPTPHDGRYVAAWDSNTRFGDCAVTSTPNVLEARVFESLADLMAEYSAVSKVQPRRPDGEPNRPLRGLSIEILALPEGPST